VPHAQRSRLNSAALSRLGSLAAPPHRGSAVFPEPIRTQIYLDESQDERLGRLGRSAGVTKSNLIREAIDVFLAGSNDGRDRLARFHSVLDAVEHSPISLPDGASYVEELRSADSLRLNELDRRAARRAKRRAVADRASAAVVPLDQRR